MGEKVPSSLTPSEALVRKAKKPKYRSVATHIEGLFLRAVTGEVPILTRKNLGTLAVTGRRLAKIDADMEKLKTKRAPIEQRAIAFAKEHPGVSGIESKTHNFRLSIFPKYEVKDYDPKVLEEALGAAYSTVVGEGLTTTVSVPFGLKTSKGMLDSEKIESGITAGLVGLGLRKEQVRQLVNTKPFLEIQEVQIGELIINDQVTIPDEVAVVTEEWNATTAPLRK